MKYRIFDFDDTLVKTDSKIGIKKKDGTVLQLSSGQYATYKEEPGDVFDMSQFTTALINPRAIRKYVKILQAIYKAGSANLVILTARGDAKPVAKFLRDIGILSGVKIVTLNSGDPMKKSNYIEALIKKGANDIEFWDDAQKYITVVDKLKRKYPKIKLITHLVPSPH